ncbi:MAG: hypothetical protein QOH84_6577, partial [Kribbellaceae bacterium]|nr:hypothetical protein [Kribbellaceae bacterium]
MTSPWSRTKVAPPASRTAATTETSGADAPEVAGME